MNLNQLLHDTDFDNFKNKSNVTSDQADDGFDNLDIAPILRQGINRLHFKTPTPIQKASIPVGIRGQDIIAIALTGSGKTLAFVIPMLQRLSKMKKGSGLILVPTRELALQVEEALQTISHLVNIRSTVLIGGASINLQWKALKKNPRIIIATPGRLMDHIERRSVNLANVEVFILDEADRMLDMGFLPDIKKIMKSIPENHQTMLFSATMPKEIEAIAEKFMIDPIRIEADRSGATPAEISHEMFLIKNQDKNRLLAVQLKLCTGPVLVFTRTKRMASKLTLKVKNMGFAAAEIHSDRSLGQRRSALDGFKQGRYQILIATDIAARGIDVSGIELVVNYDMPANSEDYVHRIGRTGRAGKTGHAISFATEGQESSIRSLERFMKTKLVVSTLPSLPTEELLLQEADYYNVKNKLARGEKPSSRKSPQDGSSKYQNFGYNDVKTFGMKLNESKKKDFKGTDSNWQKPKRRVSRSKYSQSADFNRKDSGSENPHWTDFKKNRPAKKKSVGQGSKRKNRTRRK